MDRRRVSAIAGAGNVRHGASYTAAGRVLASALTELLLEGGLGLLGGLAGVLLGLLEELHERLIAGLLGILDVLLGVGGGLKGVVIDADNVVEGVGRASGLLAVAHL